MPRSAQAHRRLSLVLAAGWLAGACADGDPSARPARTLTVDARGVLDVTLAPGERLEVSARAEHLGDAPRLHLWDREQKREAASAEPGWLGRSCELAYRNANASPRHYALLLEASGTRQREVELLRGGRPWLQKVALALPLSLPAGKGDVIQLAAVPAGVKRADLFGFDCNGRLRAHDSASGPTGLPRIAQGERLCSVIVSAAERGKVRLLVNDPFDRDGDGLGRALERALSLCDDRADVGCADGPLAGYYRAVREGTRDSDRDGLLDADEVLGRSPRVDLPRYGADPRHKDVFVEVDHDARLPDVGLSEQDFVDIAARYAVGSARELRNPDGRPGVSLHFDAGFLPADPQHVALLGAWGGSGRAKAPNYRAARAEDFSQERVGVFRYAFITRTGRGQARRDAFTVNRDLQRVSIFTHELGHTLGLEHHGADEWGDANCKPNYFSLMNYVFQNREDVGFSRATSRELDPAAALEAVPLDPGVPAALLRDAPLELDVSEAGIDWNRDGLISRDAVRAGVTWATYKSCGASGFARTTLPTTPLMAATPVLSKLGERLYVVYGDAEGLVHALHGAVSGLDDGGSCPEGDGPDTRCMTWSLESLVHGLERVRSLAAVALPSGDRLALAYTRDDAELRLALLEAVGEVLEVRSDVAIGGGATSAATPAVALFPARDGPARDTLLRVLYRADGVLMQASALGPEGPFQLAPVLDERDEPIAVGLGPSVTELGTGELCAVFPDPERFVRFYCWEPESDRFHDLTRSAFYSGLGPQTSGPVGLAYHRYRLWDGSPVTPDGSRGAVVLSFTEPESSFAKYPDNPHLFVSEWLSRDQPARAALYFRWRGSVIDEWTNLAAGTGLALYEDATLSALKGIMLSVGGDPPSVRLDFLPFVDGAHEQRLAAGNDFEIMERGICATLRGAACGT